MEINYKITEDSGNSRADNLIAKAFDIISRGQAAELLKSGMLLVSGRKVKPGYKVKTGEIITGSINFTSKYELIPENIDLNIVFEDDFIIVINKPAGLVVHPGAGNFSGTLVNALLNHCPEIIDAGDNKLRAGIVHRLDKDTSGLIVAAKSGPALNFLKKEFKYRRVEKKYSVLVRGIIKKDTGRIVMPIGRHPQKRTIMSSKGENLRYAETIWHVKERLKDATFVEAILKTGRTHQIRVHFYETGHPLIGEKVYQFRRYRNKKISVPRQMLHSSFLSFRHPFSGRKVSFTAPLPDDFKRAKNKLAV